MKLEPTLLQIYRTEVKHLRTEASQEQNLVLEKYKARDEELLRFCSIRGLLYLLCVVGRVGQHSGHMEHNLVVLVARVEGVGSS